MPTRNKYQQFGIALGNVESRLLPEIANIPIEKPIYICGLPRSGSTLLLEILASSPDVVTHRYQDFPFLWMPYVTRKMQAFTGVGKTSRERAHGDGMMVHPQSPEALEEMLWMAFFADMHNPQHSQILDASLSAPAFKHFYRDHIRKLLLLSKATRYATKGHYNITRMAYITRLFPDARFIIPVRKPAQQIASLMRQHKRFSELAKSDPSVAKQLAQAGHFEFGPNRIPINIGDDQTLQQVQAAWQKDEEVRGWALYWDMIYRFIHQQLEVLPALQQRALIVPFEELCAQPSAVIEALQRYAEIENINPQWKTSIRALDSQLPFTQDELALIDSITRETAQLYYR